MVSHRKNVIAHWKLQTPIFSTAYIIQQDLCQVTRRIDDIRLLSSVLCPAPDQVTDYIVLYNVSRKTNHYKHNAWLQNKQEKVATLHQVQHYECAYYIWKLKHDAIDCIQLHCSTRPLPGRSTMSKSSLTPSSVSQKLSTTPPAAPPFQPTCSL